jgi:hypothetical protein
MKLEYYVLLLASDCRGVAAAIAPGYLVVQYTSGQPQHEIP